jgi:CheY-like chemotaxis protein
MSAALAAKAEEPFDFRRADGQKHRVLYAEDQASARIVTTALLERMGFEVEAVEDGELALDCAMKNPYDVILLDIEMPVMDGVTAARNIRAKAKHCSQTPILALSAFLADSTETSVWRDAFDSALPKPANSNELQKAMHRALNAKPTKAGASPHWSMLAGSLPAGTLAILTKAAAREIHHLTLAYDSCRISGDIDTAKHCRRAMTSIAASFEMMELFNLLKGHETADTWPVTKDLLVATAQWQQ